MEYNIGTADRAVRLAVGGLLAALGGASLAGALETGPLVGVLALLVGAVLIGTALTRVCLVYRVLGIDTADAR
ncbi:Protein of unknown function [Halomicrobium zhouii]|uniref:Inner membrane protein YgaP-like transmembrane domain-containing protein n=1 Tax=Halomicrobium zhouii TaxID=767519 RepID=A0A1I6M451_9EURY|nr:DUF2892 domain-containing protein [Halomicrobium zhouii]SFS10312.1 Protein of unknown function [Halomicrobium zhouii]